MILTDQAMAAQREEDEMSIKHLKYLALPAMLALLIPFSAIAHSKNERNVTLPDTVQVGSTQLRAGTYRIEWQGGASSLQVSFLRDGKVVATTPGKMVEKSQPADSDEIVTTDRHNTKLLEEIDFGGKKDALVFTSNETALK